MLVVLSIFIVLGGMTFSSFDGLQNTIKMNEYMLNLEQDIRGVQRASMLLERNSTENWLYGLGIDFSNMDEDGEYKIFKWCTPFNDYGDITTTSKVPAFNPADKTIASASLPIVQPEDGICGPEVVDKRELRNLYGYEKSVTMPKSRVTYEENGNPSRARYLLFESVSGRAFFYDQGGALLNYQMVDDNLIIMEADDIEDFAIRINPYGKGSTRTLVIKHLSGRIDSQIE